MGPPRRDLPGLLSGALGRLAAPGWGLATCLAFVVSCVATWPLVLEVPFLTRLRDLPLDDFVYYWNDWWVGTALASGKNPFFCDRAFHPEGASLAFSPLAMPLALFSVPFQWVLGPLHGAAVSMKVAILASFPIAILGTARFLERAFGVPRYAGLLAGCLFAFTPFRICQVGRVHYLAGALVPWFLERLHATAQAGDRRGLVWATVSAGLVFAFAAGCDASLVTEIGFAACAFFLFLWRAHRIAFARLLQRFALAFAAGLVGFAPILLPMLAELKANPGVDVFHELRFEDEPTPKQLITSPDGNNLLWFVSPSLHAALFPRGSPQAEGTVLSRGFWDAIHAGKTNAVERWAALLLLLPTLAFCVLGVNRKSAWFAGLAVFGLVLALGPYRRIGDEIVRMPYEWLSHVVPGLRGGRYSAANIRLFHLGYAVLAAVGLARFPRWGPRVGGALLVVAFAGWIARPMAFEPIRHEGLHEAIAADPAEGAVADLPLDMDLNLRRMAIGQVLHERPIVGGPLTRVSPDVARASTGLPALARLLVPPRELDPADPALQAEIAENERQLAERGIRFVVLRRYPPGLRPTAPGQEAYLALHPNLSVRAFGPDLLVRVDHW